LGRVDQYTRGKKAAVDWTALSENQHAMISRKYLPADFVFREPSKMKKAHYRALLEHWYRRQRDDTVDVVFAFKGYWDPSSESVMAASDVPDARPKRAKLAKRKCQPARPSASKPKPTNADAAKKTNKLQRRSGPPGVRKGDSEWSSDSEEGEVEGKGRGSDEDEGEGGEEGDGGEDEEEGEGEGEEEDKNNSNDRTRRITRSKAQPMELPFSAPRIAYGAFGAPRKTSKPNRLSGLKNRVPDTKGKPARRTQPPGMGSRFERPATRSGAKRKADDAGLQATGEPSSKKGKKDAASSERKVSSTQKKKAGRV
jgi:hypothetical protein